MKGLLFYNCCWQAFEKEVWTESSEMFDTVMTEPTSAPSQSSLPGQYTHNKDDDQIIRDEVTSYAAFCETFLNPGGTPLLSHIFIWLMNGLCRFLNKVSLFCCTRVRFFKSGYSSKAINYRFFRK